MPAPRISRIALYVRDIPKVAQFYAKHFGFAEAYSNHKDKVILKQPGGNLHLVLLQASKGHKIGQSVVKIIFDVEDVAQHKAEQARLGLKIGTIHRAPDYQFANVRDPAKNLLQISSGYVAQGQ